MLCISLTVHEKPEILRNQLENYCKFVPGSFVVIHLSFSSFQLRPAIEALCHEFDHVYLNPLSTPTTWGWMFHCHLINFEFAVKLGLPFEYYVLDASAGMFVRSGAAEHIKKFDFLSNHEHARADDPATFPADGGIASALFVDPSFHKMLAGMGTKDIYLSQHEGMAFERHFFDEMMQIFSLYYSYHLAEVRYQREELYFSTVAGNLSSKYSNPITWMGRCPAQIGSYTHEQMADLIRNSGTVEYKDLHKSDTNFGRNFYALKPVARDIHYSGRRYISSLAP